MYDMKGFGARIAALRKSKDMTQDELAQRLGITGQAVSKWENNLAYPDITIIPTLCTIFEVSLDDIFGKEKKDMSGLSFPPVFQGLPLVAVFANIACYSDKEPEETGGSTVTFKDGSIAELQSRRVVNKGSGRTILKTADEKIEYSGNAGYSLRYGERLEKLKSAEFQFTETEHNYGEVLNLECSLPCFNCEIEGFEGEATKISAAGLSEFMEFLEFDYVAQEKLLKIDYDKQRFGDKFNNIDTNRFDLSKNIIRVSIGNQFGGGLDHADFKLNATGDVKLDVPFAVHLKANINGSGDIHAEKMTKPSDTVEIKINGSGRVHFNDTRTLKSNINGSGDIKFNSAAEVESRINGSGNVNFNEAEDAALGINGSGDIFARNIKNAVTSINGSGDIEIQECEILKIGINGSGDFSAGKVTKSINASINGAGDIAIKSGEVETFDIRIGSSGEVNAKGVTTDYAKIEMRNKGKVEIGRVKIESVEICGDDAELIIHQRG